ncbi:MAG: hypothetical protein VKI39_01800 [Synechococcus sp.]|nr:hypothetical protein [Synechococcus sp.]
MADAPYLVALSLVEIAGKRALPLTGRSLSQAAAQAVEPGEAGRSLALDLLLRLWQRSDEGPLRRAAGEASLLLVEIPLAVMSEQLPLLKASWLSGGETQVLLDSLKNVATRGWRISIAKYEAVKFTPWP